MKTKIISLLMVCILIIAMSGCSVQDTVSSSTDGTTGAEQEDRSSTAQTSATSSNNNETSSDDKTTAGTSSPTSSKGSDTASGVSSSPNSQSTNSGKGRATSSAASPSNSRPPSSSTGQTPSSKPSSSAPSSTPSQKPESGSSATPPSSSNSDPAPSVPDYLKPYVYPFDVARIKADLIAYGESLGMTHYTHSPDGTLLTPENCSWWDPYPLSASCKDPAQTWRQLREVVSFDKDYFSLDYFTIYIEAGPDNQYKVYLLH